MNMIEKIKRFIFPVLKYVSPFFLVMAPLMAMYGFIIPWPPIESELEKHPNNIAILSGINAQYQNGYEIVTKSYLLVNPKDFKSISISLSVDSNGKKILHQQNGGLISMLLSYFMLIYLTYYFWFKKCTKVKN